MLCSSVETGIGCIATSVPSLRHYLQRAGGGSNSRGPSGGWPNASGIKTISQQRVRDMKRSNDWEVLQDRASNEELESVLPPWRSGEADIKMEGLIMNDRE